MTLLVYLELNLSDFLFSMCLIINIKAITIILIFYIVHVLFYYLLRSNQIHLQGNIYPIILYYILYGVM
jgi:hypothetical protein